MSEFSKQHLNQIQNIHDLIEKDEAVRRKYENDKMYHSFVDWYCNNPVYDNPTVVFMLGMTIVDRGIEYGFDVSNPDTFNWSEAIAKMLVWIKEENAKNEQLLEAEDRRIAEENKLKAQAFDSCADLDLLGMYGGAEKVNAVFNQLQQMFPEQKVVLDNFRKE